MTKNRLSDERVDVLVADALERSGRLVPIAEREVAEATSESFRGELPDALTAYRPPDQRRASRLATPSWPLKPAAAQPRRERFRAGRMIRYVAATAVGAAAAGFAFWAAEAPAPPVAGPEPRRGARPVAESEAPIHIGAVRCSGECCGGSACSSATPDLRSCSSGRSCVPCDTTKPNQNWYRLRVGALALSPSSVETRLRVEKPAPLLLCVTVGAHRPSCFPPHGSDNAIEPWRVLPEVVSQQDLLAGVTVEVKQETSGTVVGTWSNSVVVRPELLCRGLRVKVPSGDVLAETYGSLSVFLDDAHHVELARGESVGELVAARRALSFADVDARIFETTREKSERFALVVGPIDRASAERLRWKLLEAGQEARLTVGADLIGEPRP